MIQSFDHNTPQTFDVWAVTITVIIVYQLGVAHLKQYDDATYAQRVDGVDDWRVLL